MNIPTLSFNALKQGQIKDIKKLKIALESHGFFYLGSLPLSNAFLDKLLDLSREFFRLSQTEKEKIHINRSPAYRGYSSLGAEATNQRPDFKESLDFALESPMGKPLHGPNQWPTKPDTFSSFLQTYYKTMTGIGDVLLACLAKSYDKQEDYFSSQFIGAPFCLLRVLCYPPTPVDEFGIGPHCDYGCLNCLYQDDNGGLELQDSHGDWHGIAPKPYHLLINSGDMLSHWTNQAIRSMPHRVIHRKNEKRISIPFFFEPGFDTMVTPMSGEGDNLHYGEHLLKAFKRSFIAS